MDPRPYQTPASSLSSSYVSSNSIMRPLQPPYPHNGQYFASHDHSYGEVGGISQADSSEIKGPGFEDTQVKEKVFNTAGATVQLEICASIQKGFFEVDSKWTCYRRNYFTVSCSFQISPHQAGPFYLTHHGQNKRIEGWAMSITAKTAPSNGEASQDRGLVQHTPKRDKTGETVPGKHAVSPQTPQQHQQHQQHHHHSQNPLSHSQTHHHHHHLHHHTVGHMGIHDPYYTSHGGHLASLGRPWPETNINGEPTPPSQYTFERIQFQKATANNGKRRAQQQFFHIVVQLSANVHPVKGQEEWILVAEKVSDPMVVRGRSPGHYKDSHPRQDRDPRMEERSGGHGHDSHRMSYGGYSSGGWNMQDGSQRGHHSHFSGGTHRSCLSSSASPPSGGSSATLHGSSTDAEFNMSDSETLKPGDLFVRPRVGVTATDGEDTVFSLSRKRGLEDDSADENSPYQFHPTLCEHVSSPVMDYPAFPQSKVLCASS